MPRCSRNKYRVACLHFHGVSIVVGNRSLTASADVDNETVKLRQVDTHRFVQVLVDGVMPFLEGCHRILCWHSGLLVVFQFALYAFGSLSVS